MDKRSLLAIVLCLLILIVYQEMISYFYPPPQRSVPTEPLAPAPSISPGNAPLTPAPQQGTAQRTIGVTQPYPSSTPRRATREITVDNEVYTAVFTSLGGRLKSLRLKHYPGDAGRDSPPLEMVRPGTNGELPLGVRLEGKEVVVADDAVQYEVVTDKVELRSGEQATVTLQGTDASGVSFTKTLSFSGQSYGIGLEVQVANAPAMATFFSLLWVEGLSYHQRDSSYHIHGPVALIGRKFIQETPTQHSEEILGPAKIRWAGYADNYFLSAMIPPPGDNYRLFLQTADGTVTTKLMLPWQGTTVGYTVYVGPKEFDALNAVDPSLDRAIDFGWFHFIARPLVSLLRFSHSLTGNYGVDIIILTLLVKILFFPLSNKSYKSMSEMRKLQPQMERLRAQYKDDPQQLNKELMELYRRYKINPLGGCLPMLVQLPVFIGLYQAFLHAIELRQAPFFGWIQDLSQPDRLGSIALPFIEPPGIPVLTLLMGGTMWVQQAMTPMGGDPTQQKIMMLMPLVFTIMFVNFPSGLVLYWLVNNILSIAQQYWYTKKYS
jgi:YidC/Oxa1 family membrane protein insertase